MLTMTQVDYIRYSYFNKGMNISQIAKELKYDWKTVAKYVEMKDFNQKPKKYRRKKIYKLDPYKKIIEEWLTNDMKERRKQRHTAIRVFNRLTKEFKDFNCSYRTVASFVNKVKKKLYKPDKAYIPLDHPAGEAQVDFGEADFIENGTRFTGKYLNVSFPHSNAGFFQVFRGENQECLLEGMKRCFEHIGGVPPVMRFDNPSTIVVHGKKNGKRVLTDGFLRFKQHYGFEAQFCNVQSGNEKGNVEAKVGYHRRNFMVPVPSFKDLEAYNESLWDICIKDQDRPHYRYNATIEQIYEEDKAKLLPLPQHAFECCIYVDLKANGYAKFNLFKGMHSYSVAPSYANKRLTIKLTHNKVIPLDANMEPIVVHNRLYGEFKQEAMDWLPYLFQIARKPNALKYTGLYQMLPQKIREHLMGLENKDKSLVLTTLAQLTKTSSFDKAAKVLEDAIELKCADPDSIYALNARLNNSQELPKMDVTKMDLPPLPSFKSNITTYDTYIAERR